MKKEIATLQSKKEIAWDNWRNNTYPVDPNFRWVCMDTRVVRPVEMATSHLFNCVKMIWNHNVPVYWHIEPFTEYRGAYRWPAAKVRVAVYNLLGELLNRTDRTKAMDEAITKMNTFFHKPNKFLE